MDQCSPQASEGSKSFSLILLKRFFSVVIIYFKGDEKWKARGIFLLMLILCAASTGLFVVVSYTQRDFSTALSEKKVNDFYAAVWRFVAVIVFATPLFAVYDYVQGVMAIEWRRWLTEKLLGKYFENRSYFEIKMASVLDNPDQRIAEDINDFTANSVILVVAVTEKILNMAAFAQVLWSISPGLVYFLLAYSAVCVFVSIRIFGRKLMVLHFETLQREADFRYSLVRVRENAEAIAFYRGEKREGHNTRVFLARLVSNIFERLRWNFSLSLFQNIYEYATVVIPSLIIAPRYFRGEVEFGVVMQSGFAFQRILAALTFVIQRFDSLSGLAAQTDRLESLLSALGSPLEGSEGAKLASQAEGTPLLPLSSDSAVVGSALDDAIPKDFEGGIVRGEAAGLRIEGLVIALPSTQGPPALLFPAGLSLALPAAQSLLIMGPSGCGKSSLLRVVAGLWSRGRGAVHCPADSAVFFLPQRPYMPLGSLREQLLFPGELRSTDQDLLAALRSVGLEQLAGQEEGLGEVRDWADCLSVGEQQRLAFARLLVHGPEMVFLDEATAALDARNESRMYGLVRQRVGTSYVSIGHRSSLLQFHDWALLFDEDGAWKVLRADQVPTLP